MKKVVKYLKIGGLIAVPIVLLLLPSNFFDNGRPICVSRVLFDVECYACGMTRGIMHLIHFDFEGAWAFNKLSVVVLPLLGIMWLELLLTEFGISLPFMSPAYKRKIAAAKQQKQKSEV